MNAEEFLRKLKQAMPDRATLESYGLDEEEIADIQSTFLAARRGVPAPDGLSEVERMVVEYDCSKLQVGLVTFNDQLVRLPEGSCFGACEADPLVVVADKSVAMYDHAVSGVVSFHCASNGNTLLSGLAQYVSIRKDREAWVGREDEATMLCAEAAGGSQYSEFFRMLCGVLGEDDTEA